MRQLFLILACFFALTPFASLKASDRLVKVGEFNISAVVDHGSFLLEDGNTYKPISKHQKRKTAGWQLGDKILILQGSNAVRFLLVNNTSGEKAVMKIVPLE